MSTHTLTHTLIFLKTQAVSELPNEHLHVWIFYKFESKHKNECISYKIVLLIYSKLGLVT